MTVRLLLALLLCAPYWSFAADWVLTARTNDGIEYSIDRESVTVVSQEESLVEAWDRMTTPRLKAKWSYNNIRRRILHDCVAHKTEIIEVWRYSDDFPLRERDVPNWATQPMDIKQGSVGYSMHRTVCSLGAKLGQ
jgi:hypothetical protein